MVMPYCVVIPAFNAADTLADAVGSIMAQTVLPERIIVVDDGSTDATVKVLEGLSGPIHLVQQDNRGPGAATTLGFTYCDQPLVATLDADDLWLPNKIAYQQAHLSEDTELAAVFCKLANFHADPQEADFAAARGGWSRSTMLIRRDVIERVGPIIDPPGRAGEMVDWFARAQEQGNRMALLEAPLALRRIRPGSLTYRHSDELARGYLHVARAALLRRRGVVAKDD